MMIDGAFAIPFCGFYIYLTVHIQQGAELEMLKHKKCPNSFMVRTPFSLVAGKASIPDPAFGSVF
jgi:hypothetical protein